MGSVRKFLFVLTTSGLRWTTWILSLLFIIQTLIIWDFEWSWAVQGGYAVMVALITSLKTLVAILTHGA
jgi:hypothetical protein